MLLQPKISPLPPADPALDQRRLAGIGLDGVRRLSRRLWTDHNTHDPGITTLELLAYALTDLAYRARFPIEDLLAAPEDNAVEMAKLFDSAGSILPGMPVTEADYRKLLIDLPGVKNVDAGLPWREKWARLRNPNVWPESAIVRVELAA
jgi:hypothetical protein